MANGQMKHCPTETLLVRWIEESRRESRVVYVESAFFDNNLVKTVHSELVRLHLASFRTGKRALLH